MKIYGNTDSCRTFVQSLSSNNAAHRPSQCVSSGIVLIRSVIYSRVRELKQAKYQMYQIHSDKVGNAKEEGGGGGGGGGGEGLTRGENAFQL
jgi:hypothetical protein